MENFPCEDSKDHFCLSTSFDFSLKNLSFAHLPNRNPSLRLSENSSTSWITISILFVFISFNFIAHFLSKLFCFHQRNRKSIEIIDFTDEDRYRALIKEEFQVRYGPRSSIGQKKPYHLYRHLTE